MSNESQQARVRIFLVDDHEIVRSGLRALLATQQDLLVVGEAAEGLSFLDAVDAARPDVVVMDVSMPVLDGIEATRRLKAAMPEVKVITLTAREERSYLELIMAAGASGYVLKRSAADELVLAIRAILAGGVYLDPSMAASALAPLRHCNATPSRLSEREAEVLRMIAEGHAVKDVATRLGISTRTLETYRARAMDKLGLKTRADIVRHALQRGWLRSE
jgi:DNA-binding NarL/FixJ family response regulator